MTTPPPDAGQPALDALIKVEIDRRLANPTNDIDYFISLLAQNDFQKNCAPLAPPSDVTEAMVERFMDNWFTVPWRGSNFADIWKMRTRAALTAALSAPARVGAALSERGIDRAFHVLRAAWDENPINDPPSYPAIRKAFEAYFEVVARDATGWDWICKYDGT